MTISNKNRIIIINCCDWGKIITVHYATIYSPIITNKSRCCIADKILGTLGEGTFGKVVKVKDLEM